MIPATQPVEAAAGMVNPAWINVSVHWPGQTDLISWCNHMGPGLATLLVLGGIVYLVFGVYLYKVLITINLGIVGAYVGAVIGYRTGGNGAMIPWALIGAFCCAALAWPLMRYAVALMGGLYGFMLGAAVWRTPPRTAGCCTPYR